jgi:hypothetical protein
MRAWTRACVAGLTLWILAGSSLAGTLEVQFALDGQVMVSLGLFSPPGSTSGTARVVLNEVDSVGAITGILAPASLQDLTLQTTLNPVGVFRFSQVAPAAGAFDGAKFGIEGGLLTFLGVNPFGTMAPFSNQLAFAVGLASVGTAGAARLMFDATLNGAGNGAGAAIRFALTGREVSRRFVPEPGPIGLVAVVLGAISALLPWIRARQRAL